MLELKPVPKPVMNEAGNQFEERKELDESQTKKGAFLAGGLQSHESI